MEQRRRQTSVQQLSLLVEFLEQHKDLALGRVRSKEARALSARLWRECSVILNSEGPARTGKEWAKFWNDLKSRVRAKLTNINASYQATGGGPSTAAPLTPLEERIGNIIGRDVGPLSNVRQDPFASQNDSNMEDTAVVERLEPISPEIQVDPTVDVIMVGNESPALENAVHDSPVLAPTPTPSITGQVPASPASTGDRNRLRRQRQRNATRRRVLSSPTQPPPAQSNRTTIDEARAMVMTIEKLRAEAGVINAQATRSICEGFKLLSESIDRLTRQYSRQTETTPRHET